MNTCTKFVELKDFYPYMNTKFVELHINDIVKFTYIGLSWTLKKNLHNKLHIQKTHTRLLLKK
jgi:hypothetical protein